VTVRSTTQIHFGEGDVSHRHAAAYNTFEIADGTTQLYLHFETPVQIDEVIAELVALRAEMTAGQDLAPRPVYRLACGCTDGNGCTCGDCDGAPHAPLTPWHCDEHGGTVIAAVAAPELRAVAS